MSIDYENPEAFIKWLQGVIDKINKFERQGREAVAKGNQDSYIGIMKQKARLLASLYVKASPYLDNMDSEEAADYAERGLSVYSYNANKALELNSVFYMSALLFPDEYKQGELHNLEIFRDEMKKKLGI